MRKFTSIALIMAAIGPFEAYAQPSQFLINGFISAGVAWTSADFQFTGVEPFYVSDIGKEPSFDKDSNVGLQVTKYLNEDVTITLQLFAQAQDDFDVIAPWAFIAYKPNDNWMFRAGRLQTNPYMLTDYRNVAYAYPWVRPPQEVYSQVPMTNTTGVDVRLSMFVFGNDFSVVGFYGSSSDDLAYPSLPNNTLFDTIEMTRRHLYSVNAKWGDEVFSIRAGYETAYASALPNAGTFPQIVNTFINTAIGNGLIGTDYVDYFTVNNSQTSLLGAGYQFDWNNIVSMGEIARRRSTSPLIANPIGWYIMGGYRVRDLLPHITFARERISDNYARRFNSAINAQASLPPALGGFGMPLDVIAQSFIGTSPYYTGGAGNQTSLTLGIRWDIIDKVAFKVEYCHVHPDDFSKGLFNINPFESVNVYTLAVNAVM